MAAEHSKRELKQKQEDAQQKSEELDVQLEAKDKEIAKLRAKQERKSKVKVNQCSVLPMTIANLEFFFFGGSVPLLLWSQSLPDRQWRKGGFDCKYPRKTSEFGDSTAGCHEER